MNELLISLKDMGLLNLFTASFGMMLISLAFVYIPGRMFEVISSYRIKNLIALCVMLVLTYFYLKTFPKGLKTVAKFIYSYLLHFGLSVILYVVLGMRLFDRVDAFLDKKGLKDKGFRYDKQD